MKPSEVYTRAAELIASGEDRYACIAIECTSILRKNERIFSRYFKPRNIKAYYPWFGSSRFKKNQRARELALYLMAEIAKEWE